MGLGFQVLAAAEAIAQHASISEVLSLLKDIRSRIRVIAMLDTLEYVRRSGRVSWARARLGSLLQVKPFVEVREEGKVISLGESRTRSKGITRLKELMLGMGELERLAILHTRAEADARQILTDIRNRLPFEPLIVNVTTVIGTHVGPNGLGFAAVVK
jgi:DegV family protein with EDD domain